MIWDFEDLKRFVVHPATEVRVADFCKFGTCRKIPTRCLCGNFGSEDTLSLDLRCSGPRGFCSRTGARHFILEGPCPRGVPRTRTAQPYPSACARHWPGRSATLHVQFSLPRLLPELREYLWNGVIWSLTRHEASLLALGG